MARGTLRPPKARETSSRRPNPMVFLRLVAAARPAMSALPTADEGVVLPGSEVDELSYQCEERGEEVMRSVPRVWCGHTLGLLSVGGCFELGEPGA
jgi:hypothetical protein